MVPTPLKTRGFDPRSGLVYLVIVALVFCLSAYELVTSYREAVREAQSESSGLASAIAANLENTLAASDHVLARMVSRVDAKLMRGKATPQETEQINRWLQDYVGTVPLASALRYFDAKGQRLFHSTEGERGFSIADREHFKAVQRLSKPDTYYSEIVLGRLSQRPVFFADKAILTADGKFDGLALVAIDLGWMQDLLGRLRVGGNGTIAIRRVDNGAALVRYPGAVEVDNRPYPSLPTRLQVAAGNPVGTLPPAVSPIDGVTRLYAYHQVRNFPFYVSVGVAEEDYLKTWRAKLVVYGFACLGLLLMLFLLARARRDQLMALQESAEKGRIYDQIFDANVAVKLIVDTASWRIVQANQAAAIFYGYTREELQSMTIADLSMVGKERIAEVMAQVCSDQCKYFESQHKLRSGKLRDVEVYSGPLQVGGHTYLYNIIHDVTERHQQEVALRTERRRLQDVIDGTNVGTWEWNVQTGEVVFNQRWAEMAGYTLEELAPLSIDTWVKLAHPDDLLVSNDMLARHFAGELPFYECEARLRHKQGGWVWVLDRGRVSSWTAEGKPLLMSGTHQDVSQRKQMEAELLEHRNHLESLVETRTQALAVAKEAAEAANRAKSAFLSMVSHELRTPLHGIMGTVALASRKATDKKQIDYLSRADRASKQLLTIINDVLDISRIEADRLTLAVETFKLADVIAHVRDAVDLAAETKGLALNFEYSPPDLGGRFFEGDPNRLAQVLINLAGNAIKFTLEGSVTVVVTQAALVDNLQNLRFSISDTGIGIEAADQARIFEAFEQVDSSVSRRFGGTGLGLSLCRKLVQAMGGEISVESTVGRGSTFAFEIGLQPKLPWQVEVSDDITQVEAMIRRDFARMAVLVAEDDPVNQEIVKDLLESVGLSVLVANDGLEATEYATSGCFDLILMDLNMPNLGGIDAALRIRTLPKYFRTPIIALTANAFTDDREDCLRAGMNDHMSKPVTPLALYQTVSKWLRFNRQLKQ